MRNDAHDELDHVPSLTADRDKPYPEPEFEPLHKPAESGLEHERTRQKRRNASVAPLWIMVVLLFGAVLALSWWGKGQLERLETQLVATQESFARISEDAAGRLQDISGKMVATESNVTTEGEALKLRIKQLEKQAIELLEQQRAITTQQQSLVGRQGNHDQRLEEQAGRVEAVAVEMRKQQAAVATFTQTLDALNSQQASLSSELKGLKGSLDGLGKVPARIEGINKEIAALKRQSDPAQAISRLEQDVLVLRSELDNRPATAPGVQTAEFDSFRAQMTRSFNTLQSQIANLQEQIDRR
ncbi:ATPase [Stutzerimonas stutzeri]|uniref:ATPase n=1 Tax=Stutzerimonas stutzeri TaxID=316 RepID=UPI00210D39EB|nr:ATPase [Stutzerimonas stutzeri]MCQ4240016.1 ATPase [Stutzerimonas stutzeri]